MQPIACAEPAGPVRRVTGEQRPGSRIVWRCAGAGAPLLLLHGGMGSWNHWVRNVDALAATYRVLVPDMPGYGESDLPPGVDEPSALARALRDGLDELLAPDECLRIAAFSFGGTVAGQLLLAMPDRIAGLALVGSAGLGVVRPGTVPMERWKGVDDPAALAGVHRRNLARLMISRADRVDEQAVRLHASNLARGRVRSVAHSLGDSLRQALAAVPVPLAGIWGELDPTTPRGPQEVAEIFQALRGDQARLTVLPDAGHWVQYEASDRFNPLLLEALRRFA